MLKKFEFPEFGSEFGSELASEFDMSTTTNPDADERRDPLSAPLLDDLAESIAEAGMIAETMEEMAQKYHDPCAEGPVGMDSASYDAGYAQGVADAEARLHVSQEATAQLEQQRLDNLTTQIGMIRDELIMRRQHIAPQLVTLMTEALQILLHYTPSSTKLTRLNTLIQQGLEACDGASQLTLLVPPIERVNEAEAENGASEPHPYEALKAAQTLPEGVQIHIKPDPTLPLGELRLCWQDGYVMADDRQILTRVRELLQQLRLD